MKSACMPLASIGAKAPQISYCSGKQKSPPLLWGVCLLAFSSGQNYRLVHCSFGESIHAPFSFCALRRVQFELVTIHRLVFDVERHVPCHFLDALQLIRTRPRKQQLRYNHLCIRRNGRTLSRKAARLKLVLHTFTECVSNKSRHFVSLEIRREVSDAVLSEVQLSVFCWVFFLFFF